MPPPDTEQARWFATEVQPHRPALRAWQLFGVDALGLLWVMLRRGMLRM